MRAAVVRRVERSAGVDAALAPDIRCRVCADARTEETGDGASRFACSTRSPMVDARSGRQQARARPILGEVPDSPALDRLIEMRSRGRGVSHAGPWCSRWAHRARHIGRRGPAIRRRRPIRPGERVVRVGCGCARHPWEATAPRGEGETTPSQGRTPHVSEPEAGRSERPRSICSMRTDSPCTTKTATPSTSSPSPAPKPSEGSGIG